jgi:hypothetical protein
MIICEDLEFDFAKPQKSEVVRYLMGLGYDLVAKTPYSLLFRQ